MLTRKMAALIKKDTEDTEEAIKYIDYIATITAFDAIDVIALPIEISNFFSFF